MRTTLELPDSPCLLLDLDVLERNMARMHQKHGDPRLLHCFEQAELEPQYDGALQMHVEAFHGTFGKVLAKLEALERTKTGTKLDAAAIAQLAAIQKLRSKGR